jgi:hypothetical protein
MSNTTGDLVFFVAAVGWDFLLARFVVAGASFFVPISLVFPLSADGSLS